MASIWSFFLLFLLFLTGSACAQNPSISITPNTDDITLFQGSEFRRVCSVEGVAADMSVRLEWVRGDQLIDFADGAAVQLLLHITEVDIVHSGHYKCRVILTPQSGSDPIINLGPMSGGTLTVLDTTQINAPAVQVLVADTSGSLTCSYPGGIATWRRQGSGSTHLGRFSAAQLSDEGTYTCDIYVHTHAASTTVTVRLFVVVPVQITATSTPAHHNLTTNLPVSLSADFNGRQSHDLTVTWYHDGVPLPLTDSRISNSFFEATTAGRSEFRLDPARRIDGGVYVVVVNSTLVVEGQVEHFSQQEASFQIDITVRPALPSNLIVDQISSSNARVSWTLTNQVPDDAADELTLQVTFANRSLVDRQELSGSSTSTVLQGLIPAHEYMVQLTASNSDGAVTTNPKTFVTLEGHPSISLLRVERLNRTQFNISLSLAYTGGGAIAKLSVSYRPAGSNRPISRLPDMSPEGVGLSVWGVVMLTEQLHGPGVEQEAGLELEFIVTAKNEFNFNSEEVSAIVPAYVSPVDPTILPASTAPPSATTGTTGTDLPVWLWAVIASVVTILVMLVLVGVTVCVCVRCRASHKPSKQLDLPTVSQSVSPLSSVHHESGILPPAKSVESIPADSFRARSQSSSVPSEAYGSLNEGLDKKHRRESSVTSFMKSPITPSTTASNSPANFKTTFMSSQDKSLPMGCINELEVARSDDSSTESERDRVRQQQVLSQQNIMNYQQHMRGHGDGSACGSSHHSLVSSGSHLGPLHMQAYPHALNYSDPKHLYTITSPGKRFRAEQNSDCESMVSSVVSMPSSMAHLRSVQYRSPTPYNHNYHQTEESTV